MRVLNPKFVLFGLLIPSITIGQETVPDENGTDTSVDGFLPGPPANPGTYTDSSGFRFFQILRFTLQARDIPATFDELVEQSSVIVRGSLSEIIPGRSIVSRAAGHGGSPLPTVFLKIVPTNVLKGSRDDYYLLETVASFESFRELQEEIYTQDLVFLLRPADNWLIEPAISLWPAAQAEFDQGKPLYQLARRSMLFANSGTGNISSPLDPTRRYIELYTNLHSLGELEQHIRDIQADPSFEDKGVQVGSLQWGETEPLEPDHGLVQFRYESGQLEGEVNFNRGVADGRARAWHQNGQRALEATFENGSRVECQAWTEDGRPIDCPSASDWPSKGRN